MKSASLKTFTFLIALIFLIVVSLSHVGIADEKITVSSEILSNENFNSFTYYPFWGNVPDNWSFSGDFNYDDENKYIFSSTPNSTAEQSATLPIGIYEFSVSAQTDSSSASIIISAIGDNLNEIQTFIVSSEKQYFSFYLFEYVNESVTFQTKINSVTDNCEVKIYSVSVKLVGEKVLFTENGASIRTVSNSTGLRFKGGIDKNFYDKCIKELGINNVETGIMIVPQDYLTEKQFTVEDLGVDAPLFIKAKKFNNDSSVNIDGYYGFNCAMTDVAPENTDRRFSARTYLKYIIDENAYYAYANYDENQHCRSVYEIAERAKQDVDNGLISDTETITAIDEYLDKIQTSTYKYAEDDSTDIFEENGGKIYYLNFTSEKTAIMQITSDNSDITATAYANDSTLLPKNGYYLLPANSKIKICFNGKPVLSVYLCPVKSVTVKLYSLP